MERGHLVRMQGVRSRSWALYGLWEALCEVCILRQPKAERLGCVLATLSGPLRDFASRPATISPDAKWISRLHGGAARGAASGIFVIQGVPQGHGDCSENEP